MCHGCVSTESFVLDYHALLVALHVHRIEIPNRAFPERVGPRILSLQSDEGHEFISILYCQVPPSKNKVYYYNYYYCYYYYYYVDYFGTSDYFSGRKKE